jgi:hypothetical protein
MPGFMPGIHVFAAFQGNKTWMAGTSPAMTIDVAATLRPSFRDGAKRRTRNPNADATFISGFRVRAFGTPRNDRTTP